MQRCFSARHWKLRANVKITFDGDVLSGMMMLDKRMIRDFSKFSPHLAIHDLSRFERLNSNACLPDLMVQNVHNWLEEEDYELHPEVNHATGETK